MPVKDPVYTALATLTDAEGKRATVRANFTLSLPDKAVVQDVDTAVAQWAGLLAACSNAQLTTIRWTSNQAESFELPAEVAGAFDSIEDKATLGMVSLIGSPYRTQVPAPGPSFLTDDETIDPSNANIGALIAGFITTHTLATASTGNLFWTSSEGDQLATFISGYRKRAKTRRRLRPGIWTEQGGD